MQRLFHALQPLWVHPGVWMLLLTVCLFFPLLMMRASPPSAVVQLEAAATPTFAARSVTFSYDAAGRLVSTNYSGPSLRYQYDASGNLITQTYQTSIYLPVVTKSQ